MSGKLLDTMNQPDSFVEFVRPDDTAMMIAKTVIMHIEQTIVPRTDQLTRRLKSDGVIDPYKVLGVTQSSSGMEIQSAYHALARRYHPDHFSGREIPPEVLQYVSAMFQRITMAYNELKPAEENASAA